PLCSSSTAALTTVSVTIADADGDQLTVVWTVDGAPIQTNQVVAGVTSTRVDLIALFAAGPHQITVTVFDAQGCAASCSTSLTAVARGDLYPIALSQRSLAGLAVGAVI